MTFYRASTPLCLIPCCKHYFVFFHFTKAKLALSFCFEATFEAKGVKEILWCISFSFPSFYHQGKKVPKGIQVYGVQREDMVSGIYKGKDFIIGLYNFVRSIITITTIVIIVIITTIIVVVTITTIIIIVVIIIVTSTNHHRRHYHNHHHLFC